MTAARTLALLVLAAAPALAEPLQPAELPPPDFAGQQYRDSRGCLFVRAGTQAEVLWIPRVSRDGAQLCQVSPSTGQPAEATPQAQATPADESQAGPYFVAVGGFATAADAETAEAKLAAKDYGYIRGQVQSGDNPLITVFAGPFADAAAADAALADLRENGFAGATLVRP